MTLSRVETGPFGMLPPSAVLLVLSTQPEDALADSRLDALQENEIESSLAPYLYGSAIVSVSTEIQN
jgi:hypothetical protein